MHALCDHQLRGVAIQPGRTGYSRAERRNTFVWWACDGGRFARDRGEPHAGQVGIIFLLRFVHAVQGKMASTDDLAIDCPGIFQRGVQRVNRDSFIDSVAIPENGRRRVVAAKVAVPAADMEPLSSQSGPGSMTESSALNTYNQAHDVKNLFITDIGSMVSSSCAYH
jgi:hypothetical protein